MRPDEDIQPTPGFTVVYVYLTQNNVLGLLRPEYLTVQDLIDDGSIKESTILLINEIGEVKLGVVGSPIEQIDTNAPFFRVHFDNDTYADMHSKTKLLINEQDVFSASYNNRMPNFAKPEPHIVSFHPTKPANLKIDDSITSIYLELRDSDGKKKGKSVNYYAVLNMDRTNLYKSYKKKAKGTVRNLKINKLSATIDRPSFPLHHLPLRIILGYDLFSLCYRYANRRKSKFKFKPQIHHFNNEPRDNEFKNLCIYDTNMHIKHHKRKGVKSKDAAYRAMGEIFQEPCPFPLISDYFTDAGCRKIKQFRTHLLRLYDFNRKLVPEPIFRGGFSLEELEIAEQGEPKITNTKTLKPSIRLAPHIIAKVRFTMELAGVPMTEQNWNKTIKQIKSLEKQPREKGTKKDPQYSDIKINGLLSYSQLKKKNPTYLREQYDHLLKSYKEMRDGYRFNESVDQFPIDRFHFPLSEISIIRPGSKNPKIYKFLQLCAFIFEYNSQITLDEFVRLYKLIRCKNNEEFISYMFPTITEGLTSITLSTDGSDRLLEAVHPSCIDSVLKDELLKFIVHKLENNKTFVWNHRLSSDFFGGNITLLRLLYNLSDEDGESLNHRITLIEKMDKSLNMNLYKIPIYVPLEENEEYPVVGVGVKEGKGNLVMVGVENV